MEEKKIIADKNDKDSARKVIPDQESKTIKPLRTLKGDLAELIASDTLQKRGTGKIDKTLRDEAIRYGTEGGDAGYISRSDIFRKRTRATRPDNLHEFGKAKDSLSLEEEVNDFIHKTTTDVIADNIGKARKHAEELRESFNTEKTEKESLSGPTPDPEPTPTVNVVKPVPAPSPAPAPPPPIKPPPPPPSPDEILSKQIADIEQELSLLPSEETRIKEAINTLNERRARIEKFIAPLIQKESALEAKEHELLAEEAKTLSVKDKRLLEERRWVIEDARKEAEQKRWKADQDIIKIIGDISKLQELARGFTQKKETLSEELAHIEKKRRALTATVEREGLLVKQKELKKAKDAIELSWIEISEKRKRLASELSTFVTKEQKLEEIIAAVETQEVSAQTREEQHKHEALRWQHETKRRSIEQSRWKFEDGLEDTIAKLAELKVKYQTLLSNEKTLAGQISELELLIQEAGQLPK